MRFTVSHNAYQFITFGVSDPGDDRRPLFAAAHTVACSVAARGGEFNDFLGLLMDGLTIGRRGTKRVRSNQLWEQLSHRRGKPVDTKTLMALLDKVWSWAKSNTGATRTTQRAIKAQERADAWQQALDSGQLDEHPPYVRAVLEFIISETKRREFPTVAAACRTVAAHTGLSRRWALEGLRYLREQTDILVRTEVGGNWEGSGKASLYRLNDFLPGRLTVSSPEPLPKQGPASPASLEALGNPIGLSRDFMGLPTPSPRGTPLSGVEATV